MDHLNGILFIDHLSRLKRDMVLKKLAKWRSDTNGATWKAVAKKFNDAGIDLALLCYNMQDGMKDDDIEYGFSMAKGLGVKETTALAAAASSFQSPKGDVPLKSS